MYSQEERIRDLFCDIYQDKQRAVYAYFLSVFASESTAEELAQITFEKIWRYLCANPYFVPVQLDNWVFRVAANVKNNFLRRKQAASPCASLEGLEEILPDQEEHLERRIQAISIREAFAMLDQAEQALLTYKGQGLTSAQMEQILKIPASTLRSRLATAKKHFSQHLRGCGIPWEE